jgi:pyrroloquinoline quinone (PQQ) biosynthesis protein C
MLHPSLKSRLESNRERGNLLRHHFFRTEKEKPLSREQAGILLGQWWHPLHCFPTFLAGAVATAPDIACKSSIAKILYQELGEGCPDNAHERLYVETMVDAGFSPEVVSESEPLPATRRLVDGYLNSAKGLTSGLGYLYATETVDLFLVGSIGSAITRTTGKADLPWVDIHVAQEPEHVVQASVAVSTELTDLQTDEIVKEAETMWSLWVDFFSDIHDAVYGTEEHKRRVA